MILFEKYFSYRRPDEMLQDLYDSKSKVDNHDKLAVIHHILITLQIELKRCHQVQIKINLSKY